MPYVPGAPNPYFPKHKYHGIPLNRNIQPIRECLVVHYVGLDARPCKGVEVDILTPEHLWATFQREAQDLLKENGEFIADPERRNRRINAAYAKLWLADNRFQWAGLAAFASKQVGCGLLHARHVAKKNDDEVNRAGIFSGSPTEAAGVSAVPVMVRNGSNLMYQRLGDTSLYNFLDIYPLHRFYMERGWKEFVACLDKRQNIWQRVSWPFPRDVLPFGKPFQEIEDGFKYATIGDLAKSVKELLKHEQVNILQTILYNDQDTQNALDNNQFAWVTKIPTADFSEIQITFSAQCKARPGRTVWFPRVLNAKLYDWRQRMEFVNQAADRFNELINGKDRRQLEESLRIIAAGGGVG